MHIYYLKYNNYYNRKFKREASLPDYLVYEVARTENLALWNPADGVETSIVANIDIPFGAAQPDYAVLQGDTVDDYINSRWFIMEMVQLRKGQYRVSLRRDVIVDSIEVLENTTNFLAERGFVEQSNKLALQPENITVNRIKTKETPIKDETGVPWIVGYLNRTYEGGKIEGNMEITPMATYNTIEEFPYYQYQDNWFNCYTSDESTWFRLYWWKRAWLNTWVRSWDIRKNNVTQNSDWKSPTQVGYSDKNSIDNDFPTLNQIRLTFSTSTWIDDIKKNFGIKTKAETDNFLLYKGAIIKVADKYYELEYTEDSHNYEEDINKVEAKSSADNIRNLCESLNGSLIPIADGAVVYAFRTSGLRYKISLKQVFTTEGFSINIPSITNRPHLDDAPYDMFAIPYGEYKQFGNEEIAGKAASSIMATLNVGENSNLYDIQLLPFAPQLTTTVTDIINKSNTVIGKMYWSTKSTIEKTILLENPITPENKKIDSIINLYRLVSPNYSGQFEFTAAANESIYGFNVSTTYMPYNPYIKVAPIFGGLYGKDYKDARGLICGGDFSLPAANNAWVSYQQNNKNYNAIFNRNIESLEFTNDINRKLDKVGATVGTIQGTASGAQSGMVFGGGAGAIIGAAIGGGAAGTGGYVDIIMNESLRQEQLSLTRDLQRLNLGNIQAQPYSLAKTTPFTANNKIFPILEYYTCSPEEKELVEKFIENNSFNLGAVIPFKQLLMTRYNEKARQWIQGRVVEFPNNFGEDYHFAATLNRELAQGYSFKEYKEV